MSAIPVERLNAALEGRYRIERELGEGGMATVYLARDEKHNRNVALKVFQPALSAVLGADRFLQEIRITARLQHPHILPLFDSGEADGLLYYVMPAVVGETLGQKLRRERQLDIEEGLTIGKSVAAALHYAHRQGVVHRDIKPENVILSDGLPVVADFGIARAVDAAGGDRLTRTGISIGTPGYMSPEQAAGDPVDGRSDVYALGCLVYEMLTGEPPYSGETAQALFAKLFSEPVPSALRLRESIPQPVDQAIQKALAKSADERFDTPAEFAAALIGHSTQRLEIREALAIAPAKRTPFVAREQERASLLAALDDAVHGQGSLVLVSGEPGVGKTRLAEEILLEAQSRKLLCFIGHSYEGEGTAPYTPFVETLEYAVRAIPKELFRQTLGDAAPEVARIMPKLRKLFPDIAPAVELPPEQQRRYLFNSYREFVERGTLISPLVILLDDLHWADEPSLLLLEHLAQHLPTQRTLIIGTYRDVELETTRPFARTLSNLTRQRLAQRVTLRRFSESAVHDLLAALAGNDPPPALVASIYNETEGNPFFVEEVFRDLEEEGKLFEEDGSWLSDLDVDLLEVPEGVRLVLGRRLDRVGEEVEKILTAGAVVGRRFDLRIVQALKLLADDALLDALEAAEEAHLIEASSVGRDTIYQFSHELIRQTLVGRLSIPKRQRLHLRISKAMERVFGSRLDDLAADYGFHLYQAGAAADPDTAVRYLTIAGDQALEAAAFEEALDHFERALSIEEDPEPRRHADLLRRKGAAHRGLGAWPEAMKCWTKALPTLERLQETETVAVICHDMAWIELWMTAMGEGKELLQRGLLAIGDDRSRSRARLLAVLGFLDASSFDPEGGLKTIWEAAGLAAELGDAALVGLVESYATSALYNQCLYHQALEVGKRSAEALREANDIFDLSQVLAFAEMAQVQMGMLEDARVLSPEVRKLASDAGNLGAALLDDMATGLSDFCMDGDLDRFIERGRRGSETWDAWSSYGVMGEAVGLFFKGEWELAAERASSAVQAFPEDNMWTGDLRSCELLLHAYAATGNAGGLFREREGRLPRPGQASVGGEKIFALCATEALVVSGDKAAASALYQGLGEFVNDGLVLASGVRMGLGQRYLGIGAACGGLWDLAEEHFRTALAQAHNFPVRVEQPETRRWHAWMLLERGERGDADRARALLAEALLMYDEIGMPRHRQLAERML